MRTRRFGLSIAVVGALCAFAAVTAPRVAHGAGSTYRVDYQVWLRPAEQLADVEIRLGRGADKVRWIRFRVDADRHSDFSGDGKIETIDGAVIWEPPAEGGRITFTARINQRRGTNSYDGLMTEDWAVFRGDDLVPPAAVRTVRGAESRARLFIRGPENWSAVTPFPKGQGGWFTVENERRRFDRPTGWMAAGRLGIRREAIAGTNVIVAGPVGQRIRRMDVLAFLNWNLPELKKIFPQFPGRLLIIVAGDPMWRGGLSGPASMFLHASRPLISENGTSTLLHELVHVAQGYSADPGGDWIVEGFAEFYSVEVMRRTHTLSEKRARRAFDRLAKWGGAAEDLDREESTGAVTARAVTLLRALDQELRDATGSRSSLDDVARRFSELRERVTLDRLRVVAESFAGRPLESLAPANIGGAEEPLAGMSGQ